MATGVSMAVVAVLAVVTVTGIGARAKAAVIEKTVFKGAFANAFFDQETPITCADGSTAIFSLIASVSGNEFVSRSKIIPDSATNTVSVSASTFDGCTGVGTFGTGSVDNAFAQSSLQSATMVANVTLLDANGIPFNSVVVNLTLQGTGPTSSNQFHSRSEFDGPDGPIAFITHSKGTFRNATVSGSVTYNGDELINNFQFATLQQSKNGSSELQR